VANTSIGAISRQVWPFLAVMILGLFVLAFVPQITLLLPNLLMPTR
jgi:TRAP-type C4-dicarboxylate transport system permease large subunit